MKRVWAIVLAFLLVVGMIASVRVLASILATIVGGTVTVVDTSWWNNDWSYRKLITVNHSYVGSDLTNFPMLIYEIDPDLANHAQSDFDDVCFVTWDNSIKLDHEIEDYNSSTGDIVAWVRVNLTATSDTKFWMYYGNSSCVSQQNPTGVWDSNFVMVQHLNETSGTHYDSTSNDNDGTASSNLDQGTSAKIDGGDRFDDTAGQQDCINWTGSDFNFDYDDSFSFEFWMKSSDSNTYPFAKGNADTGYRLQLQLDGDLNFQMKVNGASRQILRRVDAGVGDDAWHHVAVTYNGSRDVTGLTIYVDSNIPSTQTTANSVQAGDSMQTTLVYYIGRNSGQAYWYDGYIDEFHISNTARNADWMNATYWTTHSPSSFYSMGSEEGN